MQTWIGHHYSEMIQSWGAYTRMIEDGSGGYIYIWETHSTSAIYTSPITIGDYTSYMTQGGDVSLNYRDVFVNKDGTIVRIKWGTR